MTKVLLAFPRVSRPRLSCRWIETGNPTQPLACVWTDRTTGMTTADKDAPAAPAAEAGGAAPARQTDVRVIAMRGAA